MRFYKNDGHWANSIRRRERTAVAAGRAEYRHARPPLATPPVVKRMSPVEVRNPSEPPVRHERTRFGQGILRSLPGYRAPFTAEDAQWWAEESRRAEDAEIDRLAAIAEADSRWDGWYA